MSDIPKLLPLEYCTIERAAKMLNCEIEDIEHWISIESINAYAILNKVENKDNAYDGIVQSSSGEPLTERELLQLDNLQISGEKCFVSLDTRGFEDIDITVEEIISKVIFPVGLWKLLYNADIEANDNEFIDLVPSISLTEQNLDIRIRQPKKTLPKLVILKDDLEKLNRAIHGKEILQNIYSYSSEEIDVKSPIRNASARSEKHSIEKSCKNESILLSLGVMATLLAQRSNSYRKGESPSALAIKNKITNILLQHPEFEKISKISNLNKDIAKGIELFKGEVEL